MSRGVDTPSMAVLAGALGPTDAEKLWPHLTEVTFAPGDRLFVEGSPANSLYLLVDGAFEVSMGAVALGPASQGQWLGEVGFIDGGNATATVRATSAGRALRFTHAELITLPESDPSAAAVLLRAVTRDLADRLRASTVGIVEQVGEGQYRLRKPEENKSWLSQALSRLFGRRDA